MTKVLVLYYSSYGHIEQMAYAAAEGAKSAGAEVDVKRVPELVPEELAKKSGFKLDQKAPIATVDELPKYDAIIFGSGTRFGNVTAQLRNFMDQTGACGCRVHWSARWARSSPRPPPSMAARNRPSSPSSRHSYIRA